LKVERLLSTSNYAKLYQKIYIARFAKALCQNRAKKSKRLNERGRACCYAKTDLISTCKLASLPPPVTSLLAKGLLFYMRDHSCFQVVVKLSPPELSEEGSDLMMPDCVTIVNGSLAQCGELIGPVNPLIVALQSVNAIVP
jgi:hypothetical protein